jgi:glycosyltransferase involved in cell wall biosynthesis
MLSNTQKPFVSVIVPVYNGALTIEKNIEALLNQDYPKDRYEVIYVDNNSQDSTREILAKYPVVVLEEKDKQGSYAARNLGIKHAKGEIVAFTDSDCVPKSDWISEVVLCFEKNSADVIAGNIQFTFSEKPTVAELVDSVINLDNKSGVKSGLGKTANLCATKKCLDEIGIFSETQKSGSDGEWTTRAHHTGKKIVFADRAMVYHEARNFDELMKKHVRVGQGSIGVWKTQGRNIFWILARFVSFFLPLLPLQIPNMVAKRRAPGIKYPIFKMMVVAYLCKIATAWGVMKSLFTWSSIPYQARIDVPEYGLIYQRNKSLKDFLTLVVLLIIERKSFFLNYVIRAKFSKRAYLMILKKDGHVIGGSVFSDFPLILKYFDDETLKQMNGLSGQGYQYAGSFFIQEKYRGQQFATKILEQRKKYNPINYYFVPSQKTRGFYLRIGAQPYYAGAHEGFCYG